jgi:hypothetical protein
MFREIVAAACVAGAFACNVVQNDTRADPSTTLDETVFKCSVEPILAKQCSYNACHGIALGGASAPTTPGTAALRVYTPGKLRATPATSLDQSIMALSDPERHANFLSAAGFASRTAPDDNFLLRKPLPSDWGGFEHKGGAIFVSTNDGQYQAIRAWLGGTGTCM